MDAEHIMSELSLAAWEMAEAESHERAAHTLRTKAMKRTSAIHAEIKAATEAVTKARADRKITQKTT